MTGAPQLAPLFQAVEAVLRQKQQQLNQADAENGNHGDHMVAIFESAAQSAWEKQEAGLAEAMAYAAQRLAEIDNGSARLYALGLEQMAEHFARQEISLDQLVGYIQSILVDEKQDRQAGEESPLAAITRAGPVLKALVGGMSGWKQRASDKTSALGVLDMNALFDLGIAYFQAKQRGGSRVEILAEAAASASPLSSVPHRYQSGKLAIRALLQAMKDQAVKPLADD